MRGAAVLAMVAGLAAGPAHAACDVALDAAGIERFITIAMGSEYGSETRFARWESDVEVEVRGTPTPADRATLDRVIAELNTLVRPIRISIVPTGGNVQMHFAPEDQFPVILPSYIPRNMGFFSMWWNDQLQVNRAVILISTTDLTQPQRNHLIREEFTQMLGFARDVLDDPQSMFYGEWTEVQDFTPSDRLVVRAGYCPDLRTMMTVDEVRAALASSAAPLRQSQVAGLQADLRRLGLDVEQTGVLDAATTAAVLVTQRRLGLFADGVPTQRLVEVLAARKRPPHPGSARSGDGR